MTLTEAGQKMVNPRTLKMLMISLCLSVITICARGQDTSQPPPDAPMITTVPSILASDMPGNISGQVVKDGRRMVNIGVKIERAGSQGFSPSQTNNDNGVVFTDSEGRFIAYGLPPGRYNVTPIVPGYIIQPDPSGAPGELQLAKPGDSLSIVMIKGGVITGTIINASGMPVPAVQVRAMLVRLTDGRATSASSWKSAYTDDRGIYRIYGLPSGSYVVVAGGSGAAIDKSPYGQDSPTYFPSSYRDNATEVKVSTGEEVSGIDIHYRSEPGYSIAGTIAGSPKDLRAIRGVNVLLVNATTGGTEAGVFVSLLAAPRSFAFRAIQSGEYFVSAQKLSGPGGGVGTTSRRVTITGSDVTGIQLSLAPLASITGKVALEVLNKTDRKPECIGKPVSPEEIIISAARDTKTRDIEGAVIPERADSYVDNKSEFVISGLETGRFFIQGRLPGETLYIKSISSGKASDDIAQHGVPVKQGEKVTGLTVVLAEGAASLRGKVVTADQKTPVPPALRVTLVPIEKELSNNLLRYYETSTRSDGTFNITNIAPGLYWILARSAADEGPNAIAGRPLAWDSQARLLLRRESDKSSIIVELSPCQRTAGYMLLYNKTNPSPDKKK